MRRAGADAARSGAPLRGQPHDAGAGLFDAASASWRAGTLDADHAGSDAGADRSAGRGLRPELSLFVGRFAHGHHADPEGHRRCVGAGQRGGGLAGAERVCLDSGVAAGGDAAESRQGDAVQRTRDQAAADQAGLLGGRKPVCPPAGPQRDAACLAQSGYVHRARRAVDGLGAPCRHRAAGHHVL